MKSETGKYERFREVFSQLSDESQDRLMKLAHQLLKTHKFARQETFCKNNKQCPDTRCINE